MGVQTEEILELSLEEAGVRAVILNLVDNSGVSRGRSIPLKSLNQVARNGVGTSPVTNYFTLDGGIAAGGSALGDLRIRPDISALRQGAEPGWAWAPVVQHNIDGSVFGGCQRGFALAQSATLKARGFSIRAAFETEFMLDRGEGAEVVPVSSGGVYGTARLIDTPEFGLDLLATLERQQITVRQFHPEYGPSQFELSVAEKSPLEAADEVTLIRQTLRAVARRHGWRVSLSPKPLADQVGAGAHIHLSLWEGSLNHFATRPDGTFSSEGKSFIAGIFDALPELLAVGSPSVASYSRLAPGTWSAPWHCWGLENREAAIRVIAGSDPSGSSANIEVKVFDASSNPYLVVGGLIAAGLDGMSRGANLPPPVDRDPGSLSEEQRAEAGITRLPSSLGQALDAFCAGNAVRGAMDPHLANAWEAVRRAELAAWGEAPIEDMLAAHRWAY